MQVTYKVEGEPLEQLPDAYSEHYVQVGFWRDYTQGYDKKETFSHAYVNAAGEIYFVDCSIITAYGQIETFDNEHTVYTTVKNCKDMALYGTLSGGFDRSSRENRFESGGGVMNENPGSVRIVNG